MSASAVLFCWDGLSPTLLTCQSLTKPELQLLSSGCSKHAKGREHRHTAVGCGVADAALPMSRGDLWEYVLCVFHLHILEVSRWQRQVFGRMTINTHISIFSHWHRLCHSTWHFFLQFLFCWNPINSSNCSSNAVFRIRHSLNRPGLCNLLIHLPPLSLSTFVYWTCWFAWKQRRQRSFVLIVA